MTLTTLSSKQYKDAIDVLSKTSKHADLISKTFENFILPKLPERGRFLDIGAGPGILSRKIGKYFEHTVAVEQNPELVPFYQGSSIELHQKNLFSFRDKTKFDFVLCSHVLYHYSSHEIGSAIDVIRSHLSSNGRALIAFMSDHGQSHEVHLEFNPQYVTSAHIKEILRQKKISFQVEQASNSFTAESREQMESVLGLFAFEDCLKPEDIKKMGEKGVSLIFERIRAMIDRFRTPFGYKLVQEEDYLIL